MPLLSHKQTMATSTISLFYSFLIFLLLHTTASSSICSRNSFCSRGGPPVRFPFRLKNYFQFQDPRCGYDPDFELYCNNRSQTILTLPLSGDFVVTSINYNSLKLSINDPDNCLPRRFLQNFDLLDSPFRVAKFENYTLLNCSNPDLTSDIPYFIRVPCLSSGNYTVMAMTTIIFEDSFPNWSWCTVISTAWVPVTWRPPIGLEGNVTLSWSEPDCSDCERRGGDCGFKSNTGLVIGCFNLPTGGLPRTAKYGIIMGVGVPGLLCLMGLGCYICGKVRTCTSRNHHRNTDASNSIMPEPISFVKGLDGPTIESYPKTLLGESRRLPKPNDNTCSICLSEYQPKETLRTIPECNHYFHDTCIDEWLRLNGTCPVCRNSPDDSSRTISSSSTSLASMPST